MAEGTYEHACMRAELLGLEKPNQQDFLQSHPQALRIENDNIEAAQFEDISLQNDDLNKTSGGLTELNSILSGTQRRLNKLKAKRQTIFDAKRDKFKIRQPVDRHGSTFLCVQCNHTFATRIGLVRHNRRPQQQKKLGVCGSLTDLLRNKLGGSKDNMSYSTDPSYVPNDSPCKSSSSKNPGTINQALDDLDTMRESQRTGLGRDINQQVSSQIDKLDSLLTKADNAQYSMQHQNKQMKRFIDK